MKALSKRERIEFMLDHRRDFYDTAGGSIAGSTGSGLMLLPRMARHISVVELERCIDSLRRVAKGHCAHMLGYYDAEWRIQWLIVKTGNGKNVLDSDGNASKRPVRQRVVPSWVVPRMVERGVDYVTFEFNGEVYVPDELLQLVA